MTVELLEKIHKYRLNKLNASLRYKEHLEDAVSRKANYAKKVLADPTGEVNEHSLYSMYQTMMSEYFGGTRKNLPTVLNKRGEAVWKRALARCEESGVEPRLFMKAQFVFFSKVFGMPPEPKHFTTEKAVDRAKAFDPTQHKSKVVASSLVHKSELTDVFQWADKQLRDICRAQNMSRAEVYEKLIIPGVYVLPKAFLDADPEYKAVLKKVSNS